MRKKTPSFTVSTDKQFYHCFGCGEHGTAVGFLMNYAHLSFVEAIEELAAHAGVDIPYEQQSYSNKPSDGDNLLELLEQANQFFKQQLRDGSALAKQAIEYLKDRGLSGEIARDFEIGLAADSWDGLAQALGKDESTLKKLQKAGLVNERDQGGYYDRFRGRIIFPIYDFKGRVVAFGGRVLGEGEPKYLNSPETPVFHKGSELYNLHRARGEIKSTGFALVVEGYMDVIALAQFGIKNAVATLGIATTRSHLDRLFRYTDEIIFCFDGDKAGERAAWKALETVEKMIREGEQVKFLFLPDGYDPDTIVQERGKESFENLIKNALTYSEFLPQELAKQVDLGHLEGGEKLLKLAKPHLDKLSDSFLKKRLIEKFAQLAQVDLATATAFLSRPARHSPRSQNKMTNLDRGNAPATLTLTIMAKAISLIIQYPGLNRVHSRQIKLLDGLEINGLNLLIELSNQLDSNPDLNTAAIIERFRSTNHHNVLEKLATQHHLISDEALLSKEFEEILARLNQQRLDQTSNQLMEKVKTGQMTEEQAANQLKTLHNQRFKSSDI